MAAREKLLAIRLSYNEEQELIQLSNKLGMTQSEVVRSLVRGAVVAKIGPPQVVLHPAKSAAKSAAKVLA